MARTGQSGSGRRRVASAALVWVAVVFALPLGTARGQEAAGAGAGAGTGAGAAPGGGRASQAIFLDDEELDVEADLPSVDLVLTFKGLRYESLTPKTTFFPELLETVESAPF